MANSFGIAYQNDKQENTHLAFAMYQQSNNIGVNVMENIPLLIKEVASQVSPNGTKHKKAEYLCQCGNKFVARISHIKNKKIQSCGCYKTRILKELYTKHGKSNHRIYKIWVGIKSRCYNKNIPLYQYYGKRGIKLCKEWENNFMKFYYWAIDHGYKKELEIDRMENNGDYKPSNCHFVIHKVNCQNRRPRKSVN